MTWSWQQTYTGKKFEFPTPQPSQVDVVDIAHALALQCRFNGHIREFYSVAQHSVLVSTLVPPAYALEGLLHDASEAYLGDVITPVKGHLHGYKELEAHVDLAICLRFGMSVGALHSSHVKQADLMALALEATQLLTHTPVGWDLPTNVPTVTLIPLSPDAAKRQFLARFQDLVKARVLEDG